MKEEQQQGQSIILVAIALISIVIFAAIAVDVSNTYVHRRTAQNAADASALAGARELARQLNTFENPWEFNEDWIKTDMNDFAERNGTGDTDGNTGNAINTNVTGFYLDASGERVSDVQIGDLGFVPFEEARGVEAFASSVAPTFFGGVMGLDGIEVSADSAVIFEGACADSCVMPIATLTETFQTEQCYNIYDGWESGSFGWLHWQFQKGSDVCKCSSTCLIGNMDPLTCASGRIEVDDWVASDSGVSNASGVRSRLEWFIDNNVPFTVIIYDVADCYNGKCDECAQWAPGGRRGLAYHVVGFAKFQLVGYSLATGGGGGQSYGHDGDGCLGPDPTGGNRLTGYFLEWVEGEGGDCDPAGTIIAPSVIR